MQDLCVDQRSAHASQFGIDMGGISISRNGQSIHITENGEVLSDKGASVCDSCFVPYPVQEMVRIIDDELVICRRCYLRNRRQQ